MVHHYKVGRCIYNLGEGAEREGTLLSQLLRVVVLRDPDNTRRPDCVRKSRPLCVYKTGV